MLHQFGRFICWVLKHMPSVLGSSDRASGMRPDVHVSFVHVRTSKQLTLPRASMCAAYQTAVPNPHGLCYLALQQGRLLCSRPRAWEQTRDYLWAPPPKLRVRGNKHSLRSIIAAYRYPAPGVCSKGHRAPRPNHILRLTLNQTRTPPMVPPVMPS